MVIVYSVLLVFKEPSKVAIAQVDLKDFSLLLMNNRLMNGEASDDVDSVVFTIQEDMIIHQSKVNYGENDEEPVYQTNNFLSYAHATKES